MEGAEKEPPPPRASARAEAPLFLTLAFLPILAALVHLSHPILARWDASLSFPFQIDSDEGFLLQEALDLYLDKPIYRPVDAEPYTVGNYPPLMAWVMTQIISPGRIGLVLGRALVATSSLLIGQFLMLLVVWRARRLLPALVAPFLFFVSYEFYQWSAFCRVDLPALMLSLLGLFLFSTIRPRWGAALAALVLVAAGFTKQTSVAAPAACVCAMLLHDRRRLPWFVVPYAGAGAAAFLLLNSQTGGEFFRHTVAYNQNALDWVSFGRVMKNEVWFFYRYWILALLAAGFGILAVALNRPAEIPAAAAASPEPTEGEAQNAEPEDAPQENPPAHANSLAAFYLLFAGLSILGYAKLGAAPNYVLEPLAAAAWFVCEAAGRFLNASGGAPDRRRTWARASYAAVALLLAVHAGRLLYTPVGGYMMSDPNPTEEDREVGQALLQAVIRTPGDVIVEYPIFATLAGKTVLFEPFIMTQLAREGKWDQSRFVADLARARFGLVVTTQDLRVIETGGHLVRYTPEMARAILSAYKLEGMLAARKPGGLKIVYYLWTPAAKKPEEGEPSVAAAALGT